MKKQVQKVGLFTLIIIFNVVYMTGGLMLVKNYAASEAAHKAQVVDAKIRLAKERAFYATAVLSYRDSLRGCARGNLIRVALQRVTEIQIGFLNSAAQARQAAADTATDPTIHQFNQTAANSYRAYARKERIVKQVDCKSVITKPVNPETPGH